MSFRNSFIRAIELYQHSLSFDHGWFCGLFPLGYCRYHPTCSEYTKQSILRHGISKGFILGLQRILRCHPWAAGGVDPAPRKFPISNS